MRKFAKNCVTKNIKPEIWTALSLTNQMDRNDRPIPRLTNCRDKNLKNYFRLKYSNDS